MMQRSRSQERQKMEEKGHRGPGQVGHWELTMIMVPTVTRYHSRSSLRGNLVLATSSCVMY
jgi:hypothetical protein